MKNIFLALIASVTISIAGSPAFASSSGEYDGPNAFDPSWSPDGGKIAFSSEVSGTENIWVLDLQTSQLNQLTDDPVGAGDPAWTSDGQKIYFRSARDGYPRLYSMNANGTNELPVSPRRVYGFAVAPNQQSIVIEVSERIGAENLILIDLLGSPIHYVSNSEFGDCCPKWAPDSQMVQFGQAGNLWRVNAQTLQGLTQVLSMPAGKLVTKFDWAANGWTVLTRSDMEGLFLLSPDGSTVQGFLAAKDGNLLEPNWSPDGNSVVFVYARATDADLWRINADGTNLVRLTDLNALAGMMAAARLQPQSRVAHRVAATSPSSEDPKTYVPAPLEPTVAREMPPDLTLVLLFVAILSLGVIWLLLRYWFPGRARRLKLETNA